MLGVAAMNNGTAGLKIRGTGLKWVARGKPMAKGDEKKAPDYAKPFTDRVEKILTIACQ